MAAAHKKKKSPPKEEVIGNNISDPTTEQQNDECNNSTVVAEIEKTSLENSANCEERRPPEGEIALQGFRNRREKNRKRKVSGQTSSKLTRTSSAKTDDSAIDSDFDDLHDDEDIEEVIGEIVDDDADLYDMAVVAVEEAEKDSDSDDEVETGVRIEDTGKYQREKPKKKTADSKVMFKNEFSVPNHEPARIEMNDNNVQNSLQVGHCDNEPEKAQRKIQSNRRNSEPRMTEGVIKNAQGESTHCKGGLEGGKNCKNSSKSNHTGIIKMKSEIEMNKRKGQEGRYDQDNDFSSERDSVDSQEGDKSQTSNEESTKTDDVGGKEEKSEGSSARNHPKTPRQVSFNREVSVSSSNVERQVDNYSFPWWMAFILLILYLHLGMFMFVFGLGWGYIDSFYFAFVSLSTIGFGDVYYQPSVYDNTIYYIFTYTFFGFCYTSMCMNLCSQELIHLWRRVAWKIGYYRSRRWKRDFRAFWKARKLKAPNHIGRWTLRRRKTIRARVASHSSCSSFG